MSSASLWLDLVEERIAIMQFDAGLPESLAKAKGWADTVKNYGPCPAKS